MHIARLLRLCTGRNLSTSIYVIVGITEPFTAIHKIAFTGFQKERVNVAYTQKLCLAGLIMLWFAIVMSTRCSLWREQYNRKQRRKQRSNKWSSHATTAGTFFRSAEKFIHRCGTAVLD